MKIKINLLIVIVILAFTVAAIGQTETPRRQVSLYGIHSLDADQSLRVALQNPRFSDREIIPCVRVRVVFDVYAPDTTETGRLRLVSSSAREVLLDSGEAAAIDFAETRSERLVSVSILATPEGEVTGDGSVRIASTLSVRESGRTILNLPAVEKGFDPQPDPPLGE